MGDKNIRRADPPTVGGTWRVPVRIHEIFGWHNVKRVHCKRLLFLVLVASVVCQAVGDERRDSVPSAWAYSKGPLRPPAGAVKGVRVRVSFRFSRRASYVWVGG